MVVVDVAIEDFPFALGYGMLSLLSCNSVSQYTTRTFTTPAKTVKFGGALDIDVNAKIDEYTPMCVTNVWSNHAASCVITQFGLRDDGHVFATVKNLEVANKGTWNDLKLSVTVLYRKSIA